MLVIISTPAQAPAIRERLGKDPAVAVFADTDSLKALELIATTRPKIVALNPTFADTARGAALVAQLKSDSDLSGIDLRVLIEDEQKMPLMIADHATSAETALLEISRPLSRAGRGASPERSSGPWPCRPAARFNIALESSCRNPTRSGLKVSATRPVAGRI